MNFGTRVTDTAAIIFAPSLAIPPASASFPTMKPVMFCRKTSGIPRWSQSSMKCAALSALSLKRIPLFATIPTRKPKIRAKPHTTVVP